VASAVVAALDQEQVEVEIVVVTRDPPEEALSAPIAALDDPRVRLLRDADGLARARNIGIRAARAPWVAFLDDDDLWAPDKLRRQLAAARAARAGWAYAAAIRIDARGQPLALTPAPPPASLRDELRRGNPIPAAASNVIARAELLRRLGGFDEELSILADWELWIRLAGEAPATATGDVLVAYVQHPHNMIVETDRSAYHDLPLVLGKHRDLGRDPSWFYGWVAEGHRRAGRRLAAAGTYLRGAWRARSPRLGARGVLSLLGERAVGRRVSRQRPPPRPPWLERRLRGA
jgi:glycosyltransferase involved in cell wall biosynthesis